MSCLAVNGHAPEITWRKVQSAESIYHELTTKIALWHAFIPLPIQMLVGGGMGQAQQRHQVIPRHWALMLDVVPKS